MSTRAISAYLVETHKVTISAATIAKALREPEKHLESLIDLVEPSARVFSEAHDIALFDLLGRKELFEAASAHPPGLWGETDEDKAEAHHDYNEAARILNDLWFATDSVVRNMALGLMERAEKEGGNDRDAE